VQFPRPWHLQVRLRAAACYIDRPGRQRHAEHQGQVDLPRYRADLPLDGWSDIRKSRASRRFNVCEVGRQVHQQFEAGGYPQSPSRVRAVDRPTAIPSAEIHPVLTLETAHGHDEAGVGDIRPVRRDLVFSGRASVSLCVDGSEDCKRRQQTYLESSLGHRLAINDLVAFGQGSDERSATLTENNLYHPEFRLDCRNRNEQWLGFRRVISELAYLAEIKPKGTAGLPARTCPFLCSLKSRHFRFCEGFRMTADRDDAACTGAVVRKPPVKERA